MKSLEININKIKDLESKLNLIQKQNKVKEINFQKQFINKRLAENYNDGNFTKEAEKLAWCPSDYENDEAQKLFKAGFKKKLHSKKLEEILNNDKFYQSWLSFENEKQEINRKLNSEIENLKESEKKELEINRIKELDEAKEQGKQVIIFVDGVKNNWGGRFGITDIDGRKIEVGNNGQITEQIEIEAYAILKGVNWAVENQVKSLKIMTDCQVLSYGTDFNSKTSAGKYYWLARKIAKESNIDLEFEWIPGKENKADYLTRK